MDRRMFLQLAAAPALLGAEETPSYKIVTPFHAAAAPHPYRGQVTEVRSETVIDTSTRRVDQASVDRMLEKGMTSFTGQKTERDAWASFFNPSDVVGVKVNCSGAPDMCASPQVVGGIVRNLVAVGVQPANIYIYERFLDQLSSVHYDRFVPQGVNIFAIETPRGSLLHYDPKTYVEVSFFGEDDTRSCLARLVTERLTKIVNVPNMKEHQAAGVTGCLKNMAYGDFSNVARSHMREKTNTFSFIGTLASVEPLRSKVVLNIMDGIRAIWHGGPIPETRDYDFFPKTILFGTDPIAMDRLLLDTIEAKRKAEGAPSLFDRSMALIDRTRPAHKDFHKNTFIREPGHIEYAARHFNMGEYDRAKIKVTNLET